MSEPKRSGRRLVRLLLLATGVGIVALAVYEGLHWYRHVYEPNARIESELTVLASRVNGTIDKVHVRRGTRVEPGELLVSMDTAVATLDVRSLAADLEKERATRREVEAELAYFVTELEARIETAREALRLQNREQVTLQERLEIARINVERNRELLRQSVVAKQRIDEASDKQLEVISKMRDLDTSMKGNERKLVELLDQRQRTAIYESRLAVIDRTIDKLRIVLEQSERRLRDMHVYSPIRGVVNETYVTAGAYVEDADRVVLLHDPSAVWVAAGIDESDIRHVKPGQPVVFEVDAYPFEAFRGTVRSIGAITQSLTDDPRSHAAARDVQRIPVVIDIDPIEKPLWPGMRASVNIVIR